MCVQSTFSHPLFVYSYGWSGDRVSLARFRSTTASYPFEIIFSLIHFRPSSSRFYPLTIAIFLYRISRGRMAGIAGACPPPDTGRGRGPQDTSSAKRDEVDCGRGRSERSERSPPQYLPSARRGRLSKQALLMYTYIQHFHILSIKTAIFMDKAQLLMGLSIETGIFMDNSIWKPLSSTEQGTSVDKHT